jgi:hypothetical protein
MAREGKLREDVACCKPGAAKANSKRTPAGLAVESITNPFFG